MSWRDRAACLGADPDLFFPERGGHPNAPAKAVCGDCPVSDECLAYAVECRITVGVWGGTTDRERRTIRRRRRQRS